MRDPQSRPAASPVDLFLYLAGIAGVAAGITLLFLGMRAVMDVGGFCAEGGPYVVAQGCPDGAPAVSLLGFFGGLGSAFLAAWKGAAVGGGAAGVVFLAWPALFGALGLNFLQYGFDPPGDDPGWAWGWLISGVVFEAMAIGPLLLGAWAARAGLAPASPSAATPGGRRLEAALREARATRAEGQSHPGGGSVPGGPGPTAPASTGRPPAAGAPLVDALERLATLHGLGSLTDEEFARAKAQLLEQGGP